MKLSIVVIGDELLLGQVTDTNSGEIARALGPMGWEIAETAIVGDSRQAIEAAVRRALGQSDLVITTGGLGPTKDDITKPVLMSVFGGELALDEDVLANVRRVFDKRGLELNDATRSQALVPTSCRVIQNELGTAPIMWFELGGKALVAMPGVPFETAGMLHRAVKGEIMRRFAPQEEYLHSSLVASGITESGLSEHLAAYEASLPAGMHLAYLPTPGYVRLRLDGVCSDPGGKETFEREFERQARALRQAVGPYCLCEGDATPAEALLAVLRERGLTVGTAESCTGGNIAHRITTIAGCSDCYMGTVVSYANSVKAGVLGVSMADIESHGAVSETVARQMAEGAARVLGADCAMATTGIAGPGGAVPGKPVGTVWIAVATPAGTVAKECHFPGNRARVIDRATTEALLMLVNALRT